MAKCMLAPLKNWDLPTGPPLPTPMYNLYIALYNIAHFCGRVKWMRIAYTCHSYTGFSLRFHLEVTGTAKVVDKSSKIHRSFAEKRLNILPNNCISRTNSGPNARKYKN